MSLARSFILGSVISLASYPTLGQPTALVSEFPINEQPQGLCEFVGDAERVEVRVGTTKIADLSFCSAYGGASAEVFTDRAGVSFLPLRFGEGHGSNARSEYLSVYRVAASLDEYVRTPLSGAASVADRWEFAYTVSPLPEHGLRIHLRLHRGALLHFENYAKSSTRHHRVDDFLYNPSDAERVIDVGAEPGT